MEARLSEPRGRRWLAHAKVVEERLAEGTLLRSSPPGRLSSSAQAGLFCSAVTLVTLVLDTNTCWRYTLSIQTGGDGMTQSSAVQS